MADEPRDPLFDGAENDPGEEFRDMLRDYGPRIRATIDNMTERTLASWQHFRDEAVRDAP